MRGSGIKGCDAAKRTALDAAAPGAAALDAASQDAAAPHSAAPDATAPDAAAPDAAASRSDDISGLEGALPLRGQPHGAAGLERAPQTRGAGPHSRSAVTGRLC